MELAASSSVGQVVLMSEHEARACVRAINRSLEHARDLLLDLYEREGWRTLGYRNWRDCVRAEFAQSQSALYHQLQAARVERDVRPVFSNLEIRPPDSQLRPLATLETAEERREVWLEAVATAPGGQVTERHVRSVITQHQHPEAERTFRPELRSVPACTACAQFTDPDNWFVTDAGTWVWAGSDAPPHLRAISA